MRGAIRAVKVQIVTQIAVMHRVMRVFPIWADRDQAQDDVCPALPAYESPIRVGASRSHVYPSHNVDSLQREIQFHL